MKKIYTLLAFAIIIIAGNANAQVPIVVQNGSNVSFYAQLDSAVIHAQNGDTIFIPGGSFSLYTAINKRLHLIGVGHNPDSTIATNRTYLFGTLVLVPGADGGSLTGISFQSVNSISIPYDINNYHFSRCNIYLINSVISSNTVSNVFFSENVINNVSFGGGGLNSFFNNILGKIANIGTNNVVKNNIFIAASALDANEYGKIQNSIFENNIFIGITIVYGSENMISNNFFNNNLFIQNLTFPIYTNIGSNNIVNQNQNSIFVNQTGNTFDYTQNYHLQPTCLGKNAGTDGADVGIYGGLFPWKEGSVPANPHIQFKRIAGTTDQNGNLQINIKVKAQDH